MEPRGTNRHGDLSASATTDAADLLRLRHQLGKRIKEKNCLIETMRLTAQTAGFRTSSWVQEAGFTVSPGITGNHMVAYLEHRDTADEGPFLREERDLIDALATDIGASLANLAVSDALGEREEILFSIVGLAADSIGLVDMATGRFVEFNAAAHRNLGYTREEFAGLNVPDIDARGLSPEALKAEFDTIVAAGEAVVDTRHRRRDACCRGAAGKGLVLRKEFDPALPRVVNADPLRLNQGLLNLGGNAVKFTENGRITLRVTQAGQNAGNVLARFEIEDTGIGMSAEHPSRLFQPFEQADTSTARKYGGTGLGLAISRRVVELRGGHIEVDSRPGNGSIFRFTTPLRVGQATSAREVAASGPAAATATGAAREVRILLVENDPINQEVGSELLRDAGFRVDVAENGAIALERAAGYQFEQALALIRVPPATAGDHPA